MSRPTLASSPPLYALRLHRLVATLFDGNLSRAGMAVGMDPSNFTRLLNGHARNLRPVTLQNLARSFNVPPSYFTDPIATPWLHDAHSGGTEQEWLVHLFFGRQVRLLARALGMPETAFTRMLPARHTRNLGYLGWRQVYGGQIAMLEALL